MTNFMSKRPDKYDKAIAYLRKFPADIYSAWSNPAHHPAGALFEYAGGGGSCESQRSKTLQPCGCLTMVRSGYSDAYNRKLSREIRADERIPSNGHLIKLESLPVFAEWQRRLDHEVPGRPQ